MRSTQAANSPYSGHRKASPSNFCENCETAPHRRASNRVPAWLLLRTWIDRNLSLILFHFPRFHAYGKMARFVSRRVRIGSRLAALGKSGGERLVLSRLQPFL